MYMSDKFANCDLTLGPAYKLKWPQLINNSLTDTINTIFDNEQVSRRYKVNQCGSDNANQAKQYIINHNETEDLKLVVFSDTSWYAEWL